MPMLDQALPRFSESAMREREREKERVRERDFIRKQCPTKSERVLAKKRKEEGE
jgi:hypothetical protein